MLPDDSKRATIVFAYDTEDERRAILALFPREWLERSDGPRVVALSNDNELTRVELVRGAIERYSDHYDRRDAIEAVLDHPNLTRFTWSDFDDSSD